MVDADLGLAFGDLRAAERTFQLLTQVTGRAGRAGGASRALVQTFAPEHPVIRAIVSGDREAFYASEIAARREARLPPFGRLAGDRRLGPRPRLGAGLCRRPSAAPSRATMKISVLGPAEAPLAVVRGRHRFRLLVHAPRSADISGAISGPGSTRRRRRAAASGCRSTSTRRVSCQKSSSRGLLVRGPFQRW